MGRDYGASCRTIDFSLRFSIDSHMRSVPALSIIVVNIMTKIRGVNLRTAFLKENVDELVSESVLEEEAYVFEETFFDGCVNFVDNVEFHIFQL